jgi:hypothetical protein
MADYGLLTETALQAQLTTLLDGVCTPTEQTQIIGKVVMAYSAAAPRRRTSYALTKRFCHGVTDSVTIAALAALPVLTP